MVSGRRSELSSAFDDLLEQNRKQFEKLSGGIAPAPAKEPARPRPRSRPAPTPSAAAPPAPTLDRSSDVVRSLNQRYGDGWRYEITNRRRQGEEVVVRCKLIVEDPGIVRVQSGRARIDRPGDAVEITGSADGVAFAARSEDVSAGNATGDVVEAAFRKAVENALTKCAEML